jgi:Zn-dependent M28 family amino/carboxypeptidase
MFAKNGERPARSILFVCFCGEEKGLLGSRYFADNLPIPVESIVAELQMDMIGRDEEENSEGDKGELAENNRNTVHLIGTKQLAPALHDLCLQRNEIAGFDIEWDQEGMFSRSDHANFARLGIPIAFFFTGLHRDYHQTTDTPDKIHYEKLLRISQWVYDIGFELGTQKGRPEIDPELWAKYRGKGRAEPAAPMMPGK